MEEEKQGKQEKLPLDAKLLSEAVIELNISRRSVGLYPSDHPITRQSIKNAFDYLQKLFELRSSITLGITKDTLVIDEFTFDKKNPVFREFASIIHGKGISGITFIAGVTEEELQIFHELLVAKDLPAGEGLVEFASQKGLRHIRIYVIDLSKFRFVEDTARSSDSGDAIWEDYIYGLLEGRLADEGYEGFISNIPPNVVADLVNKYDLKATPAESYDRIITAYLRKKEGEGLSREAHDRFVSFINNLSPETKAQFLSRSSAHANLDGTDVENILKGVTVDDVDKIIRIFEKQSELPESLKNLIDKLSGSRELQMFAGMTGPHDNVVHDIELDEQMLQLFSEDHFTTFVGKDYQRELEAMLNAPEAVRTGLTVDFERSCDTDILDGTVLEIMLETMDSDYITSEDYLNLLTKITELIDLFLNTGRLREINDVYNVLYEHSLTGKFKTEALSMIEYYFRSSSFASRVIEAIRLWGRYDRESALMIARNLKAHLIHPMIDALCSENEPATRKFLLSVLAGLGSDVLPEAGRRLNDSRWYVVRNMVCLIRECNGKEYAKQVRQFAKDKNRKLAIEAVKTLMHFNTPDALSYLKMYMTSDDLEMRSQAISLAGAYKAADTVPYLIEMLKKKDFMGGDMQYKVQAVKSLAKIKDPRAIKELTTLYASKSVLFKGVFDELKLEIFRSLDAYPPESVKQLLQMGMTSKSDEIRGISERLLARRGNER